MARTKTPKASVSTETLQPDIYVTLNENEEIVIETNDIFLALDKLKLQAPNAKVIRRSDGKTLAFTTTMSQMDEWHEGV